MELESGSHPFGSPLTGPGPLRDFGFFPVDLLKRPYDGSDLALHVPDLVERVRWLDPEQVVLMRVDIFDAAYRPLRAASLPVFDASTMTRYYPWMSEVRSG